MEDTNTSNTVPVTEEKKVIINNVAVPVSETKTILSIDAPTPAWANLLFNIVLAVAALVTTAVVTFFNTYMNTETQLLIVAICSYTTYAVKYISKLFGLELKEK